MPKTLLAIHLSRWLLALGTLNSLYYLTHPLVHHKKWEWQQRAASWAWIRWARVSHQRASHPTIIIVSTAPPPLAQLLVPRLRKSTNALHRRKSSSSKQRKRLELERAQRIEEGKKGAGQPHRTAIASTSQTSKRLQLHTNFDILPTLTFNKT